VLKFAECVFGDQRANAEGTDKLCVPNASIRLQLAFSTDARLPEDFKQFWSTNCTYPVNQVNTYIGLGAKTMFKSSLLNFQERGTAEERLWRAVITKSLEEWICGPLSFSRKAEKFLFEDTSDFNAVCSSAGMDADRLRNRLKTLRARGIQKEDIPFRVRTQKRPAISANANWGQKAFGV
jgi:hypothetical protein